MRTKLTQEVFQRDDCPKWAKWAAVDLDGAAFWFEEKPTQGSWGVFWTQADHATKVVRIDEKFSRTVDLIERKQSQTNLEWLCEHPEELAKKLIRFDYRKGAWLAPDGTEFYPRIDSCFEHIFRPLREGSRCYEYTVSWLKQEHKENNDDDTKQS